MMAARALHTPVLIDEVVAALNPRAGAVLVDGTFGAGGYTKAILEAADCVILGSGVHMGSIEHAMQAFFERCAPLWLAGGLRGRLGAAFVSAGAGGRGGAELALLCLLANLAEHGVLLVPMHNRSAEFASAGCHWGPVAWTNPRQGEAGPRPEHLAAARDHGRQVAEYARRWLRGAT